MAELLRIGEVATTLGVSVDTLRCGEGQGRVTFVRHNNQRVLPAADLHPLMATLSGGGNGSSARNRMPGLVTSVERDGVMTKVEMACGDFRVVSLMSREAADEMSLELGSSVTAVVKATNVIVEA